MHAFQWHYVWYKFQSRFISLVGHFSEEIDSVLSKFKWGIQIWKWKLGGRQVWNWSTCSVLIPPFQAACEYAAASQIKCKFSGVSPMVQFAKSVALNIEDQAAISGWRRQNQSVSEKWKSFSRKSKTNQFSNPVARNPRLVSWSDINSIPLCSDKRVFDHACSRKCFVWDCICDQSLRHGPVFVSVMRRYRTNVSHSVTDSKNRVNWCDPGEWRYLLRTLLSRLL